MKYRSLSWDIVYPKMTIKAAQRRPSLHCQSSITLEWFKRKTVFDWHRVCKNSAKRATNRVHGIKDYERIWDLLQRTTSETSKVCQSWPCMTKWKLNQMCGRDSTSDKSTQMNMNTQSDPAELQGVTVLTEMRQNFQIRWHGLCGYILRGIVV